MKEYWSERYGMKKDGGCRWFIGHWYWWRHNHFMSFWPAVWMTFKASVVWPLNNINSWIWLRTIGRWQMKRLRKQWKEKYGKDIFEASND